MMYRPEDLLIWQQKKKKKNDEWRTTNEERRMKNDEGDGESSRPTRSLCGTILVIRQIRVDIPFNTQRVHLDRIVSRDTTNSY